jgi:hypothetical protein
MILCEWDAPEGHLGNVAYTRMLSYRCLSPRFQFSMSGATLVYLSQWYYCKLAAAAAGIARCSQLSSPSPGQVVWFVRAGIMDRPSRTKSHPAGSLSSSQPDGPPCWSSPLAFSLIGYTSTPQPHLNDFGNFLHSHCPLPLCILTSKCSLQSRPNTFTPHYNIPL